MVQIVKGKKKGRPSKADLARRAGVVASAAAVKDSGRRRSSRRRNVRYDSFVDYDDYLDEYEDFLERERGVSEEEDEPEEKEEEEEDRGKEKKLRLLQNLHVVKQGRGRRGRKRGRPARVVEDPELEEEEIEEKPLTKKRRVNGSEDEEEEEEELEEVYRRNDEEELEHDDEDEEDREQGRGGQGGRKGDNGGGEDSAPGTPSEHTKELPLPDKKALELILDKLQKKDVYGVYAEPVDLEELEEVYRRNDEEELEHDDEEDEDEEDREQGRGGQGGRKGDNGGGGDDSAPGTPSEHTKELPLPDKKALELILDKLQKKDVYGVYAEPVDLEELPDYLDIVDHPMDFSTVRKKLTNGSYATMEQFESDVFLICSNAMQYNSSDTVYYKQARTIQELAKRKFQKIRLKIARSEHVEREAKSEQKIETNSLVKKQMKKPLSRSVQEPVGSDFFSGATLATPVGPQNGFVVAHGGGCEKAINNEVHVENSAVIDNTSEKVEELSSGKGSLTKLGRKPSLPDERRATYDVPNHPMVTSESVFTTFDSEIKQLVAVGLHADYSYARSLARFAATLGPVAWKVASQKIERALPPGFKYGRGWVGEYEPLPTPVLMLEACNRSDNIFSASKFHCTSDNQDGDATRRAPELGLEHPSKGRTSEVKPVLPNPSDGKPPSSSSRTRPSTPVSPLCQQQNLLPKSTRGTKKKKSILHATNTLVRDGISPADCSAESETLAVVSPSSQQQNLPPPRNYGEKWKKSSKLVELNLPPSSSYNDNDVGEKQHPVKSEIPSLKSTETPGKTDHRNAVVPKQHDGVGVASHGLSNGKSAISSSSSKMVSSSAGGTHNTVGRPATLSPQSHLNQGLTDPVEAIRMSAQKAQNQQKSTNPPSVEKPAVPLAPSVRNDSNNAAVTAARAWMSIGAGGYGVPAENSVAPKGQFPVESLYNPTWQLRPQVSRVQGQFSFPAGMQVPSEKNNFPFQAFMPQPFRAAADGAHFQNRPMIFPQLVATDLSRFQMQSPWRGHSPQSQPRQKPDTLPPDLNIGFHSPGSPGKQSSGPMADSQQPDLALQL